MTALAVETIRFVEIPESRFLLEGSNKLALCCMIHRVSVGIGFVAVTREGEARFHHAPTGLYLITWGVIAHSGPVHHMGSAVCDWQIRRDGRISLVSGGV